MGATSSPYIDLSLPPSLPQFPYVHNRFSALLAGAWTALAMVCTLSILDIWVPALEYPSEFLTTATQVEFHGIDLDSWGDMDLDP